MVILESPLLFISSSTRLLRTTEEDPPEFVKKARLPAHSDLVCAKLADLVSGVWPLVTAAAGPCTRCEGPRREGCS